MTHNFMDFQLHTLLSADYYYLCFSYHVIVLAFCYQVFLNPLAEEEVIVVSSTSDVHLSV